MVLKCIIGYPTRFKMARKPIEHMVYATHNVKAYTTIDITQFPHSPCNVASTTQLWLEEA